MPAVTCPVLTAERSLAVPELGESLVVAPAVPRSGLSPVPVGAVLPVAEIDGVGLPDGGDVDGDGDVLWLGDWLEVDEDGDGSNVGRFVGQAEWLAAPEVGFWPLEDLEPPVVSE